MKKILIASILFSGLAFAEDVKKSELENKLETLNIPTDKVTPLVSEEKLYSVNGRYSSLKKRHELTFYGSNNFNTDSHIQSTQTGGTYRFHVNERWSAGARYQEYFNKLDSTGQELYDKFLLTPDVDYAIKSTAGFVNFNTVYGKLRFTKDTIVYFDQYIALGYGEIHLADGATQMYNVDLGFAFWIGKHMSSRIGARTESYTQKRLEKKQNVHNMLGYIEFGYLFGEGSRI